MKILNSNRIPTKLRAKPGSCAAFYILVFAVLVLSGPVFGEEAPPPAKESKWNMVEFPRVPPAIIKQVGYILPFPESEGSIIATYVQQSKVGLGDTVYLDIGSERGVSPGDRFTVARPDRLIYHPVLSSPPSSDSVPFTKGIIQRFLAFWKGYSLGYLIDILGELEVLEVKANESKAIIREAYQEMSKGDRVITLQTPPELTLKKEPAGKNIDGYIIASRQADINVMAMPDVVYLDAGLEQSVELGDMFEVYVIPETEDKIQLMPHVVGELVVVNAQSNTSTAVILKSNIELQVGQKIRYKK